MIKLSSIKPNPDNPRVIKDESFDMLKKSIQDFPDMMKARPIVVDENNMVMGGNQRLKALLALGFKEVHQDWVKKITDFTKDQWQEFIIKDNVWFGQWNWNGLDKWDDDKLNDWGLDNNNKSVDYSIIEGENNSDISSETKRSIQIGFYDDDYAKAIGLVNYFIKQDKYLGGMILDYLTIEKSKNA
jgi:hypothetical protein